MLDQSRVASRSGSTTVSPSSPTRQFDALMRVIRATALGLTLAALTVACGGGSTDTTSSIGVAEPTPGIETGTTEPAETPTEQPAEVEVGDEAFEAAAIAALEANPPDDLFAWDVLDAQLQDIADVVLVDLCGWDGNSVDDEVLQATYNVEAHDGAVSATLESFNPIAGDCNNTELIESMLRVTRNYDAYWSAALADPDSFDRDIALDFMTEEHAEALHEQSIQRANDGLTVLNTDMDSNLPESAVQPLLQRSYVHQGIPVRELLVCRQMPDDYGLYRGDVLVDDYRGENERGIGGVLRYQMRYEDRGWVIAATRGLVWFDCTGTAEAWLEDINASSFGGEVEWESGLE